MVFFRHRIEVEGWGVDYDGRDNNSEQEKCNYNTSPSEKAKISVLAEQHFQRNFLVPARALVVICSQVNRL